MRVINYKCIGKIGVIAIDHPPLNVLAHVVRKQLLDTINAAQHDNSAALVLYCTGKTFIAGADINEFDSEPVEPTLRTLFAGIIHSKKIIVAAMHGTALGGGLELALCCHYRCAQPASKMGFPEVKLGLLPGAGGTQRLPRLVGVQMALDMMLKGHTITAAQAMQHNLIDRIVKEDLPQAALAYTQELLDHCQPLRLVHNIEMHSPSTSFFTTYRKKIARQTQGYFSPSKIIDCVEDACTLSFAEGIKNERKRFMQCVVSPQSGALRHLFFAQRHARKISHLLSPPPTPRSITSVGIIGGGTMGSGISTCFLSAGFPVTLLELEQDILARGVRTIQTNYERGIAKGKVTEAHKKECMQRLITTTDYAHLAECDLIIEAVFENLDIKKKVFTRLDALCKPDAILASNTSYQNIDQIAAATRRPQDVLGMHFFSPAHIMQLLEVVQGKETAPDILATIMTIAKKIKKIPVVAQVCFGFIGNRMFEPYLAQMHLCLLEGALPEQIDQAMEKWGMAMGPCAVGDLAGLDIGYKMREGLSAEQKNEARIFSLSDHLVSMGRLGRKSQAGFYLYDAQNKRRSDPEVTRLIESESEKYGMKRRSINDDEIQRRLVYALINEGAYILGENIAQRSSDIDLVYVYGYGFPPYRGGPMYYADQIGIKKIYAGMKELSEQDPLWRPAPLLKELAESNRSFANYRRSD